jgi:hypothetical protein
VFREGVLPRLLARLVSISQVGDRPGIDTRIGLDGAEPLKK